MARCCGPVRCAHRGAARVRESYAARRAAPPPGRKSQIVSRWTVHYALAYKAACNSSSRCRVSRVSAVPLPGVTIFGITSVTAVSRFEFRNECVRVALFGRISLRLPRAPRRLRAPSVTDLSCFTFTPSGSKTHRTTTTFTGTNIYKLRPWFSHRARDSRSGHPVGVGRV